MKNVLLIVVYMLIIPIVRPYVYFECFNSTFALRDGYALIQYNWSMGECGSPKISHSIPLDSILKLEPIHNGKIQVIKGVTSGYNVTMGNYFGRPTLLGMDKKPGEMRRFKDPLSFWVTVINGTVRNLVSFDDRFKRAINYGNFTLGTGPMLSGCTSFGVDERTISCSDTLNIYKNGSSIRVCGRARQGCCPWAHMVESKGCFPNYRPVFNVKKSNLNKRNWEDDNGEVDDWEEDNWEDESWEEGEFDGFNFEDYWFVDWDDEGQFFNR